MRKEYSKDLLDLDIINVLDKNFNNNRDIIISIFSNLLNTINNKKNIIIKCKINKFKRRFNITSDILNNLNYILNGTNGFVLAGGKMIDFFNNISFKESSCDYDIFSTLSMPQEKHDLIHNTLKLNKFKNISILPHVIETEKDNKKYQFVQNCFSDIDNIIESFDFRTCAICTDGIYIYWIKGALKDIRNKNLYVQNFPNMISFNIRLAKYLQKGYKISVADLTVLSIIYINNLYNKLRDGCSDKLLDSLTNRDFIYSRDLEYVFNNNDSQPEELGEVNI